MLVHRLYLSIHIKPVIASVIYTAFSSGKIEEERIKFMALLCSLYDLSRLYLGALFIHFCEYWLTVFDLEKAHIT